MSCDFLKIVEDHFDAEDAKNFNPLERAYRRKSIDSEQFITKKIDNLLSQKQKMFEMRAEVEAIQKSETIQVEQNGQGGTADTFRTGSGTPQYLRDALGVIKKPELISVLDKLEKGDLNIPEKNVRQRQIMETFLDRMGSDLKYFYESDFKRVDSEGKNVSRERYKKLKGQLSQAKSFGKAYYKEYVSTRRKTQKLEEKLTAMEESKTQRSEAFNKKLGELRKRLNDVKDNIKLRQKTLASLKKEWDIPDSQWKQLRGDKDVTSMGEFAWKEYLFELQGDVFMQANKNFERLTTEILADSKKITNYQNLFEAFELPANLKEFEVGDFHKLQEILEGFEYGDTFLGKGLINRMNIIDDGGIFTIREAVESIYKDMPGLSDFVIEQKQAGLKIYDGTIREYSEKITEIENEILSEADEVKQKELKKQVDKLEKMKEDLRAEAEEFSRTEVEDVKFRKDAKKSEIEKKVEALNLELKKVRLDLKNNPGDKTLIEIKNDLKAEIKELRNSAKVGINETNLKDNKDKSDHDKVTERKLIKGGESDLIAYDTALAQKNPLYNFMVLKYNEEMTHFSADKLRIQDTLGDLLNKSRKSRARSVKDRLIPTDEVVFEYLEADVDVKAKMVEDNKLTPEDLDLANFVKETFNDFKTELMKRNAVEKFLDNYVTHIAMGAVEVYKNEGIKSAVKHLFKTDEYSIDFGILGDSGTVLGFEKFFKFGLERKGGVKPTKDLGRVVMSYTNTFYKKLALDETIPKTVLYRDILGDSSAIDTVNKWLNNKKGITMAGRFQGGSIDQVITGLKRITSVFDLGFNMITSGASMGGVANANFTLLGATGQLRGVKRKMEPQGRKILKDYESQMGRNTLYNLGKEIFDAPDITPLEVPGQLAFTLLSQTMQSGLNTAFLSLLTKAEFKSGKISDKRIAEMKVQLGLVHSLPGTESLAGNTFFGKALMQYKSWAIPLLYNNARLSKSIASDIRSGEWKGNEQFRQDVQMLGRGTMVPILMFVYFSEMFGDDETYLEKRIKQELSSQVGASDPRMWLAIPRSVGFLNANMQGLISLREKYTRDGDGYEEGDSKGLKQLERTLTPGFIKQFGKLEETFGKEEGLSSGKKGSSLSDIGGLSDLGDLGDLSGLSDLGDLGDLGSLGDLGDLNFD